MKKKELKRRLKAVEKRYKKLRKTVSIQYGVTEYDMDCLEKHGCTRDIWDYRNATNSGLIESTLITEEDLPF